MRYRLTAGTVFREETRFLREWVEYHRLVGFDHIILVNNDDKEESLRASKVLAPYVASGFVEEIRYASRNRSWELEGIERMIRKVTGQTEWLLVTDADAFLFPVANVSVPSILADYDKPDIAALAVYLCTFGMGGVLTSPALQTQAFLRRAPIGEQCNWTANFLIRPERMLPPAVAGYTWTRPGFSIVDENFLAVGTEKRPGPQQRLRLNHYSVRSAEDWALKVKRGWPEIEPTWRGSRPLYEHKRAMLDRNEEFDDSMRRYSKALCRSLGLPEIA